MFSKNNHCKKSKLHRSRETAKNCGCGCVETAKWLFFWFGCSGVCLVWDGWQCGVVLFLWFHGLWFLCYEVGTVAYVVNRLVSLVFGTFRSFILLFGLKGPHLTWPFPPFCFLSCIFVVFAFFVSFFLGGGVISAASEVARKPASPVGRPHSADKKFVRARGPQDWNPEVFEQTRCSRILHVEFPQNNRELVKPEAFEKRVFEQTTPFKRTKWKGHFPWTTVW